MKFFKLKKKIKIIELLTYLIILSNCKMVLMNPKGLISSEQKEIIIFSLFLLLLIIIPVILMTIIFSIKYNENNKKSIYKPDWDYSAKIEIICWVIPVIIISLLSFIAWKSTHKLDPYIELNNIKSKNNPITIQVISSDWKWIFIYPEYNIATINEISFPVDVPINFRITSASVMNSFFIPALGGQIYSMAGMQTKLHLMADTIGVYKGFSSSYSGHGFSNMKFKVIVCNNEDYYKWIKNVQHSSRKIDKMESFNKILKENNHNYYTMHFSYFSPNIYKDLILSFAHHHHKKDNQIKNNNH
ncbi:MAG: ubiquinol oxidase subunit II [Arsenophonus sp.]|nr:MAG: ubiquinol oxidase subunit II [Arsenophonus sp.]